MSEVQSPEQIAAEAASKAAAVAAEAAAKAAAKAQADAAKAVAKAAEKAEKDAAKAAEKEAKAAVKAAEKEAKEAATAKAVADKAAEKAAKEAQKVAAKTAAEEAKVAAATAKEAAKMPQQNGIRRPKPDGKCGQAWALMDEMSREIGSPVAIANLLVRSTAQGLSAGNVRAEYAMWRKFNGVTGRVQPVAAVVVPAVASAANEAQATAAA